MCHLVGLVEGGVGRHPSALDGTESEATLLDTRYELEARGGHAVIGTEEVATHIVSGERRAVILRIRDADVLDGRGDHEDHVFEDVARVVGIVMDDTRYDDACVIGGHGWGEDGSVGALGLDGAFDGVATAVESSCGYVGRLEIVGYGDRLPNDELDVALRVRLGLIGLALTLLASAIGEIVVVVELTEVLALIVERTEIGHGVGLLGILVSNGIAPIVVGRLAATLPVVDTLVGGVGSEEVEIRELVDRDSPVEIDIVLVVLHLAELADIGPYGIAPMLVLLGVLILIDRAVGLIDTRIDDSVEAELDVARDVVAEVEVAVPVELLGHADGHLVVRIGDVALLHLLIVAVELPTVAELRGRGVESHIFEDGEILAAEP